MPKLLRIEPQADIPSRVPYGQASAAEFGVDTSGAIAQGSQAVGGALLQATDQYGKMYRALGNEDRKLNLLETLSALKDEYAARDIETKGQLGTSVDPATGQTQGLDPVQYVPTMQGVQGQLLQKYEKLLKYPDTAAAFRAQALPFLTTEGIKARYEGLKLQTALIVTRDGMQIDRLVNQAVLAPTETEQRAAFGQALDIVREGVQSGRYSGDQGASKIKGILSAVDRGTAMRDFRNPDLRVSVIDRLVTGTFSKQMNAEEQYGLAHTMQTQFDAEQTRRENKAEKEAAKIVKDATAELYRQAQTKTKADGTPMTVSDIHAASRLLSLPRTEIEALTSALQKPLDESPSNPQILARVSADVHGMAPTISEAKLKGYLASGDLNLKDFNTLLEKRTSRMTHLQEHGQSQVMQQHSAAVQRLKAALGIPDIMPDNIDPSRLQAYDGALRELDSKSSAMPGGKDPPLSIVDDVIARWKPLVANQTTMDVLKTTKVVKYQSIGELDAARIVRIASERPMTEAEYRQERDLTLAHIRALKAQAEDEMKRLDEKQNPTKKPGGKPGKPAKPGTFSSGTELPKVQ
jgi:hypothetical protein